MSEQLHPTCLPLYLALVCLDFLMDRSTTTTPEIKYHVISPAIETNVNRILFKVERNFTSGLM